MAASTITPSSRLTTSASLRARSEDGIEKRKPALTPLQTACRMTSATAMTVRTAIVRRAKMTTRSGIQGERPAKSHRQANRIAGAPVSYRLLRPKLERMAACNEHFICFWDRREREGRPVRAASLHFILHTLCVLHTFCSVLHTFCSLSFCSLVFQIKTTRLIALPRSIFHKSPFVPLQLCQCHAERGTTRM